MKTTAMKTKNISYPHRSLLLFIFLFCCLSSKAQFDDTKYDKECFLVGLLNEYMGYQRTFSSNDDFYYQRIDIMGRNDLKNALFIDSLFNIDYPDIYIVNNGAPMGIKMYSPVLSARIDEYYNYKSSGIRTMQRDTVYYGELKENIFKTDKQKLSFLLGAFLRFGMCQTKEDKTEEDTKCLRYRILTANAPSKAKMCVELLKEIGCEDVEYISNKNYIPVSHLVVFTPSHKIQEVIENAEALKKYISGFNIKNIEFTPNGTKFIWKEQDKPPRRIKEDAPSL